MSDLPKYPHMSGKPDKDPMITRHVDSLSFREELLEEDETAPERKPGCPLVEIRLESLGLLALADSGSQVSCLSEKFYNDNISIFRDCSILPITGVSVVGATGGKPIRLRKQIFVTLGMSRVEREATFLIVPYLTKNCVLGIDILRPMGAVIDLRNNTLTVSDKEGNKYTAKIQEEVSSSPITSNLCCLRQVDNSKELTMDLLSQKMESMQLAPAELQQRYKDLLWKYRRVFTTKPGRISCYHHHLILREGELPRARSYPIPLKYESQADEQIQTMIEWGIVQKSSSPHINPLVVTTKKNGKIRLCLDARRLNEKLLDDHEGTENMETLFQRCRDKKLLSSLDMNMSFWQIPLHSDSKKYTAFLYKGKCYEYNVTPFGLKTSTAALVRGLDYVLAGLSDFIISYVDDLLIASESEQEHLLHLELILKRFLTHNITLNLGKCKFRQFETTFLGHIISAEGIRPDPDKVQAIKDFNTPKNKKQLQGFLGTVNFSAKFSKRISTEMVPILELLRKGVKWNWEEKHQLAFERIKKTLSSEIMLHFPDPHKAFYLQTDASEYAIGAVLYQIQTGGDIKIIACGSRTLHGAERAYFTTEKELLALVWSLQKYRSFLLGAHIIHRTDHMALTFLRSCKLVNKRLTRWIMAIQDYDIHVEFCPGKENIMADAISRQTSNENHVDEVKRNTIVLYHLAKQAHRSWKLKLTNLPTEQRSDPKLMQVQKNIFNQTNYSISNGLLYKNTRGSWKISLPKTLVKDLIIECHNIYGHIGGKKCQFMINEDFHYPGLRKAIKESLRACNVCQRNKTPTQSSHALAQPIILSEPLEAVFVDFYGPLPTTKYGYKYILGIEDGFCKYIKLYPLRRQTTQATIQKLFGDYVPNHGLPKRIVTDHGTQFTTDSWKEKLKRAGIKHTLTSIRHPQANMIERVNRELSKFFRILLEELKHSSWYDKLKIIENILNEVHHDTTELTPMEIMLKKKPTRFWKKWIPVHELNKEPGYEQKLLWTQERIKRKGLRRAQKTNADKRISSYQENDEVLVKACNLSDKFLKRTAKFMPVFEGPYRIGKIIREGTYLITHLKNNKERGIFHACDLRKYHNH